MNLGRAIESSYGKLLRDIAFPLQFSPSNRPLGGLLYLVLYDLFDFELFGYRVVCLSIMAINLVLIHQFVRLLSNREIAMLTVLLLAYKTYWTDLYYNTGFCYDLLCFTLYFGALFVYFRARLAGRILTRKELLIFFALFWLGLSAKEMIVSVPVVIALAEVFWLDHSASLMRRLMPAATTSAVVVVFIVGRLYSPPDGLANLELYRPNVSVDQFIHQGGLFVRNFLDVIHVARTVPMLLLFATLVLAALVSNQMAPRVGVAVALFGVLPVVFIAHRQLSAAYIPCAGLAILLAWAFVETTKVFFPSRWRAAGLFITVFALSWHIAHKSPPDIAALTKDAKDIQRAAEGIRALNLQPPNHSRILMESDPIPQYRWATNFLFWILYDNPTIAVDWASKPLPGQESFVHYAVLTTNPDGRVIRVR